MTKLTTKAKKDPKILVSESNLTKAAVRLINQRLVSPEIQFIQKQLGRSATQVAIDDSIVAVRKMPWSSIMIEES